VKDVGVRGWLRRGDWIIDASFQCFNSSKKFFEQGSFNYTERLLEQLISITLTELVVYLVLGVCKIALLGAARRRVRGMLAARAASPPGWEGPILGRMVTNEVKNKFQKNRKPTRQE
jgi:hypothetical protein